MELIEWTSNFIDNLNRFRHDLEKKEVKEKEINCFYKAKGPVKYVIAPELAEDVFKMLEGNIILVCLNKKENLSFMIKNWSAFIKNPKLKIIFANPEINQQWSLLPYIHNQISDQKSLKLGLKSIFESIAEY
jgi:hypothetical protein